MTTTFLHQALSFCEDLARQAAGISGSLVDSVSVTRKSDRSPVTEADTRIQKHIAEAVRRQYPDHAMIGEERIDGMERFPDPGRAPYCWVVDPLDGTRNFAHRFPVWCTSIALMHGNTPVVGLVREHTTGWQCSSVAGEGVVCNGRRVRIAERQVDRDILVAIPSGHHQPILPIIRSWIDAYNLRNMGSTSLHMALLAAGAVDAVLCYECKLWDVAAGTLLIAEAGGRCTDLRGRPLLNRPIDGYGDDNVSFFAAGPGAFDRLLAEIDMHRLP